MIGAGGVGAELVALLNFRDFDGVGAVLIVTVVVVVAIDTVSAAVRRRIISGATQDRRGSAVVDDLLGTSLSG